MIITHYLRTLFITRCVSAMVTSETEIKGNHGLCNDLKF